MMSRACDCCTKKIENDEFRRVLVYEKETDRTGIHKGHTIKDLCLTCLKKIGYTPRNEGQ